MRPGTGSAGPQDQPGTGSAGPPQHDVEAELRLLLASKAERLATVGRIPPGLLRRVRLRRAATAFGTGLAVILAGAGAITIAPAFAPAPPAGGSSAASAPREGRPEVTASLRVDGEEWSLSSSRSAAGLCAEAESGGTLRRRCHMRLSEGNALAVYQSHPLDGKTPVMGVVSPRVEMVEVMEHGGDGVRASLLTVPGAAPRAYLGFLDAGAEGEVKAYDRRGKVVGRESTLARSGLPAVGCDGNLAAGPDESPCVSGP